MPISGPFDGDLENTQLVIEGHSPLILCESTEAILVAVDADAFAAGKKPDDTTLGRSAVRVRDQGREGQETIRFYRLQGDLVQNGEPRSGWLRIRVYGDMSGDPVPDLAFHVYSEVSVPARSDLRKYSPRQIRRAKDTNELRGWGTRYVVSVSAGKPEGSSIRFDIPVKAKNAYILSNAKFYGQVIHGGLFLAHEPEQVRASVAAEMERWQAVNHITIAGDMQSQIIAQFLDARQESDLREIWGSFDRQIPSFNEFVRYVAGFYLYALVDKAKARPDLPRRARAFLQDQDAPVTTLRKLTYRLAEFIKTDFLKVAFDDGMCRVETMPEPGMQISPGNLTTNHRMDFSPGYHSLTIFSPKYGTCSCEFKVLMAGQGAIECDLRGGSSTSQFRCTLFGPVLSSGKP